MIVIAAAIKYRERFVASHLALPPPHLVNQSNFPADLISSNIKRPTKSSNFLFLFFSFFFFEVGRKRRRSFCFFFPPALPIPPPEYIIIELALLLNSGAEERQPLQQLSGKGAKKKFREDPMARENKNRNKYIISMILYCEPILSLHKVKVESFSLSLFSQLRSNPNTQREQEEDHGRRFRFFFFFFYLF